MTKRYKMTGHAALVLPEGRIEPGCGEFEADLGEVLEGQLVASGAIAEIPEARVTRATEAAEWDGEAWAAPAEEVGAPPKKRRGR
jgi:hypothetical protein